MHIANNVIKHLNNNFHYLAWFTFLHVMLFGCVNLENNLNKQLEMIFITDRINSRSLSDMSLHFYTQNVSEYRAKKNYVIMKMGLCLK